MTVKDLVEALEEMGCKILGGSSPSISPPANVRHRKRFEECLPWLRLYRQEVLAHYEPPPERVLCPLCRRDVTEPEDRERLVGVNPFCVRGASPEGWDRLRGKRIPPKLGCPYRKE